MKKKIIIAILFISLISFSCSKKKDNSKKSREDLKIKIKNIQKNKKNQLIKKDKLIKNIISAKLSFIKLSKKYNALHNLKISNDSIQTLINKEKKEIFTRNGFKTQKEYDSIYSSLINSSSLDSLLLINGIEVIKK